MWSGRLVGSFVSRAIGQYWCVKYVFHTGEVEFFSSAKTRFESRTLMTTPQAGAKNKDTLIVVRKYAFRETLLMLSL